MRTARSILSGIKIWQVVRQQPGLNVDPPRALDPDATKISLIRVEQRVENTLPHDRGHGMEGGRARIHRENCLAGWIRRQHLGWGETGGCFLERTRTASLSLPLGRLFRSSLRVNFKAISKKRDNPVCRDQMEGAKRIWINDQTIRTRLIWLGKVRVQGVNGTTTRTYVLDDLRVRSERKYMMKVEPLQIMADQVLVRCCRASLLPLIAARSPLPRTERLPNCF